jgi:hypothetical protein
VALSGRRCSAASEDRAEDLAGSASTVPAFLLLQHPGPWGLDATRDARWPDRLGGFGAELRAHAEEAGVRLLLIRRPGRARAPISRHRVFAVHARPPFAWAETVTVRDPRMLLDLDLAALRAGRSLGLESQEEPVFAVCTHGRHDVCCAERGRPVAAALGERFPEQSWEVSHLGGDRFAASMLVLPDGLYYGRLDAEAALAVVRARLAGELELDHLRGRTGYAMPVQAADIALRRELGRLDPSGPRLVARTVARTAGGELTTATFADGDDLYAVSIRTTATEPVALTCRAARAQPAVRHELLEIVRSGP